MSNRKVKFRIWSKKYQLFDNDPRWPNNQYSYDRRFLDSNGNVVIFVDYNGYSLFEDKEKDLIVQFSTGLKDKTGREIYEGDIVKLDDENDTFYNEDKPILVEWKYCGYEFCWFHAAEEFIIKGNILENPDLLKK